jgi:hypothetical protein
VEARQISLRGRQPRGDLLSQREAPRRGRGLRLSFQINPLAAFARNDGELGFVRQLSRRFCSNGSRASALKNTSVGRLLPTRKIMKGVVKLRDLHSVAH